MGNCGSDQINTAIKKDGVQNIKQATISRAGQREATRYYEKLSKKYPDYLRDRQQQKMKYIDKKQEDLEERVKEIHRQMEAQQPNSVQKLEKRNNKKFNQIVGYNKTTKDIETYREKVKKVFTDEHTRLQKDIKTEAERAQGEIQKSQPQLTNLSRFGLDRKSKTLKDQQGNYKTDIESNNEKIRQKIDTEFGLNKVYKERFQNKIPDSQLNQILQQFQENAPKVSSVGSGCCS